MLIDPPLLPVMTDTLNKITVKLQEIPHLMNQDLARKMQAIAEHVGDLNSHGKVKAQTLNENGYAKILSINSGTRVWIHHTRDDRMIFDLMVTHAAGLKHPEVTKHAEGIFDKFAKDAGYEVLNRPWQHSLSKNNIRKQWYFEITNDSSENICALVEKVKVAFRPSK